MKKMMKTIFALAAVSAVSAQAEQMQAKMPAQATVPNPSARWGVTGGANLFITAEALVFKIAQDQTPYAYTYNTDTPHNSKTYHVENDYKWGFRVAAGYNMSHDKWDVVATYSRFNVNNSSSVSKPTGAELHSYTYEYLVSKDYDVDLLQAKSKWSVDFNMLDVEMGRQFFVSKFLRVRPKFGLRNVWLDNNTSINMVTDPNDTNEIEYNWTTKTTENFWGMGVLAGIDTVWGLARGFSIYGNFGLSGLFGYFDPDAKMTGDDYYYDEEHYLSSDRQEMTKATIDLALGLRWDKNFYDDRYHIGFNFGFEQHIFFNMTRNYFGDPSFVNYNGMSGRDFTMSGFAFGARFDF